MNIKWGHGIDVLTRPLCGGCADLKKRLKKAGIPFRAWNTATVNGLAVAAWYDSPTLLPAVAIDGVLLKHGGDPDALFKAIQRARETTNVEDRVRF